MSQVHYRRNYSTPAVALCVGAVLGTVFVGWVIKSAPVAKVAPTVITVDTAAITAAVKAGFPTAAPAPAPVPAKAAAVTPAPAKAAAPVRKVVRKVVTRHVSVPVFYAVPRCTCML